MSQQRITVPFDVRKVKTKVFGVVTKRQLICFSLAAVVSVPTYLLFKSLSTDLAALLMVAVAIPFFMSALPPKNDLYFEKRIYNYIKWRFIFPKTRLKNGGDKIEKVKPVTVKNKKTGSRKNI